MHGLAVDVRRRARPQVESLESRLAPAIFHVTTLADTAVVNLETGQDAAGHVSLRSAVTAAAATPEADTVLLGPGTFRLADAGAALLSGQGSLAIQGAGREHTRISIDHLDQLFAGFETPVDLQSLDLVSDNLLPVDEIVDPAPTAPNAVATVAKADAVISAVVEAFRFPEPHALPLTRFVEVPLAPEPLPLPRTVHIDLVFGPAGVGGPTEPALPQAASPVSDDGDMPEMPDAPKPTAETAEPPLNTKSFWSSSEDKSQTRMFAEPGWGFVDLKATQSNMDYAADVLSSVDAPIGMSGVFLPLLASDGRSTRRWRLGR